MVNIKFSIQITLLEQSSSGMLSDCLLIRTSNENENINGMTFIFLSRLKHAHIFTYNRNTGNCPLSHIILIASQHILALIPQCCMLIRVTSNNNIVVRGKCILFNLTGARSLNLLHPWPECQLLYHICSPFSKEAFKEM